MDDFWRIPLLLIIFVLHATDGQLGRQAADPCILTQWSSWGPCVGNCTIGVQLRRMVPLNNQSALALPANCSRRAQFRRCLQPGCEVDASAATSVTPTVAATQLQRIQSLSIIPLPPIFIAKAKAANQIESSGNKLSKNPSNLFKDEAAVAPQTVPTSAPQPSLVSGTSVNNSSSRRFFGTVVFGAAGRTTAVTSRQNVVTNRPIQPVNIPADRNRPAAFQTVNEEDNSTVTSPVPIASEHPFILPLASIAVTSNPRFNALLGSNVRRPRPTIPKNETGSGEDYVVEEPSPAALPVVQPPRTSVPRLDARSRLKPFKGRRNLTEPDVADIEEPAPQAIPVATSLPQSNRELVALSKLKPVNVSSGGPSSEVVEEPGPVIPPIAPHLSPSAPRVVLAGGNGTRNATQPTLDQTGTGSTDGAASKQKTTPVKLKESKLTKPTKTPPAKEQQSTGTEETDQEEALTTTIADTSEEEDSVEANRTVGPEFQIPRATELPASESEVELLPARGTPASTTTETTTTTASTDLLAKPQVSVAPFNQPLVPGSNVKASKESGEGGENEEPEEGSEEEEKGGKRRPHPKESGEETGEESAETTNSQETALSAERKQKSSSEDSSEGSFRLPVITSPVTSQPVVNLIATGNVIPSIQSAAPSPSVPASTAPAPTAPAPSAPVAPAPTVPAAIPSTQPPHVVPPVPQSAETESNEENVEPGESTETGSEEEEEENKEQETSQEGGDNEGESEEASEEDGDEELPRKKTTKAPKSHSLAPPVATAAPTSAPQVQIVSNAPAVPTAEPAAQTAAPAIQTAASAPTAAPAPTGVQTTTDTGSSRPRPVPRLPSKSRAFILPEATVPPTSNPLVRIVSSENPVKAPASQSSSPSVNIPSQSAPAAPAAPSGPSSGSITLFPQETFASSLRPKRTTTLEPDYGEEGNEEKGGGEEEVEGEQQSEENSHEEAGDSEEEVEDEEPVPPPSGRRRTTVQAATAATPATAIATQAPDTQPPATQAPATQAPATQATVIQHPATQAPVTQAATTTTVESSTGPTRRGFFRIPIVTAPPTSLPLIRVVTASDKNEIIVTQPAFQIVPTTQLVTTAAEPPISSQTQPPASAVPTSAPATSAPQSVQSSAPSQQIIPKKTTTKRIQDLFGSSDEQSNSKGGGEDEDDENLSEETSSREDKNGPSKTHPSSEGEEATDDTRILFPSKIKKPKPKPPKGRTGDGEGESDSETPRQFPAGQTPSKPDTASIPQAPIAPPSDQRLRIVTIEVTTTETFAHSATTIAAAVTQARQAVTEAPATTTVTPAEVVAGLTTSASTVAIGDKTNENGPQQTTLAFGRQKLGPGHRKADSFLVPFISVAPTSFPRIKVVTITNSDQIFGLADSATVAGEGPNSIAAEQAPTQAPAAAAIATTTTLQAPTSATSIATQASTSTSISSTASIHSATQLATTLSSITAAAQTTQTAAQTGSVTFEPAPAPEEEQLTTSLFAAKFASAEGIKPSKRISPPSPRPRKSTTPTGKQSLATQQPRQSGQPTSSPSAPAIDQLITTSAPASAPGAPDQTTEGFTDELIVTDAAEDLENLTTTPIPGSNSTDLIGLFVLPRATHAITSLPLIREQSFTFENEATANISLSNDSITFQTNAPSADGALQTTPIAANQSINVTTTPVPAASTTAPPVTTTVAKTEAATTTAAATTLLSNSTRAPVQSIATTTSVAPATSNAPATSSAASLLPSTISASLQTDSLPAVTSPPATRGGRRKSKTTTTPEPEEDAENDNNEEGDNDDAGDSEGNDAEPASPGGETLLASTIFGSTQTPDPTPVFSSASVEEKDNDDGTNEDENKERSQEITNNSDNDEADEGNDGEEDGQDNSITTSRRFRSRPTSQTRSSRNPQSITTPVQTTSTTTPHSTTTTTRPTTSSTATLPPPTDANGITLRNPNVLNIPSLSRVTIIAPRRRPLTFDEAVRLQASTKPTAVERAPDFIRKAVNSEENGDEDAGSNEETNEDARPSRSGSSDSTPPPGFGPVPALAPSAANSNEDEDSEEIDDTDNVPGSPLLFPLGTHAPAPAPGSVPNAKAETHPPSIRPPSKRRISDALAVQKTSIIESVGNIQLLASPPPAPKSSSSSAPSKEPLISTLNAANRPLLVTKDTKPGAALRFGPSLLPPVTLQELPAPPSHRQQQLLPSTGKLTADKWKLDLRESLRKLAANDSNASTLQLLPQHQSVAINSQCRPVDRKTCSGNGKVQFVIRWARREGSGECSSYPYPYCSSSLERFESPLRLEEDCYRVCFTELERQSLPIFRYLQFKDGFRIDKISPKSSVNPNPVKLL